MKITNEEVTNQTPEPKKPSMMEGKWKYVIVAGVIIVGLGMLFMPKSDNEPTEDTTVESTVESTVVSKEKPKETTDTVESKPAEPEVSEDAVKDVITKFFTAYQEFSTDKVKPKDRAEAISNYATEEVVSELLPNALNGKGDEPSIIAAYKFDSPVEITPDAGMANHYSVVLRYTVTVAENSSKHIDTYVVKMDGDKITSAILKSMVTE